MKLSFVRCEMVMNIKKNKNVMNGMFLNNLDTSFNEIGSESTFISFTLWLANRTTIETIISGHRIYSIPVRSSTCPTINAELVKPIEHHVRIVQISYPISLA